MDNSYLLLLLPTLSSAAGAFFGSYLKKKAENVATKEDIGELTQTAKAIEAKISDDVWRGQRHWELKRDVLFDLLRKFRAANTALDNWAAAFARVHTLRAEDANDQVDPKIRGQVDQKLDKWLEASNEFDEAIMLAGTVCSPELAKAAMELTKFMTEIGNKIVDDAKAYSAARPRMEELATAVGKETKKEFGLLGKAGTLP